MGRIKHRVSLKDIAEATGVHVSTVSLAMRNDRRLSAATRERIKEAADRLGYRENPMVAAWLRHVRNPEAAEPGVGIAFLCGLSADKAVRSEAYYRTLVSGARAEAEALGYVVDETEFGRNDEELLKSTIKRLRYCGVRGVLLFDPANALPASIVSELASGFAVVVMLRANGETVFHRVAPDIVANTRLALAHLRSTGYGRIGFPFATSHMNALRQDAVGVFLLDQQMQPAANRVPLPAQVAENSPERFAAWFEKHRPEAILSVNLQIRQFLMNHPDGHRVMYAHIGVDALPQVSGIHNRGSDVGHAAVFKLAGLISGNRCEIPTVPESTLIPGVWRDAIDEEVPTNTVSSKQLADI